ncbi:hypothetical protein Agabi119p4_7660 [Agaricus bisporus var. burnettii]|uniref:Tc1-like transposase DDE domain-containing protein n=1 Tax=Agaricus bisporus var. burnettii TaxID=192524 RepID=A0A8H7C7I3_AGABI|nr:hypothetical protein Agabi119p4_7660 [Agaricus bisporus var. burnettii]
MGSPEIGQIEAAKNREWENRGDVDHEKDSGDNGEGEEDNWSETSDEEPSLLDPEIDDSNDEAQAYKPKGRFEFPPTLKEVEEACEEIQDILKPPRENSRVSYKDPGLNKKTVQRLEEMQELCRHYQRLSMESSLGTRGLWMRASRDVALINGHSRRGSQLPGKSRAEKLRRWVREFIQDQGELPIVDWNTVGRSLIDDEDIAQEIHMHLQCLKAQGEDINAEAVVRFTDTPEMLTRLQRKKAISLSTAKTWMHKMGYRWNYDPKGQYVDGHERADVVRFRQTIFLPKMAELEQRIAQWSSRDESTKTIPPETRQVVCWFHDESVFYAHDRRRKQWIHKDENAVPYAKGEGLSVMIADFFSAEYGWLRSPDGKESSRVLFRPGKARDGYFDNNNIKEQLRKAMDIISQHYPDKDHVFLYDNAKTHLKRPEGSLSALKMPKNPSAKFGIDVNEVDEHGKPKYRGDGKVLKKRIPIVNGKFADGTEQEFYYPANANHKYAGYFKGVANILEERGYQIAQKLKLQCGLSFADCPNEGRTQCCCRRILFNEPDFAQVDSILEIEAKEQGFQIIFLPKFHCELNPIEQCWGYAKRIYRLNKPSSNEDSLQKNTVAALESVPILSMRRFVTRSFRFMDAYRKGLNGSQAAWASKKYRGHRKIPDSILEELGGANTH